jgi:hypothetical protein
MNNDNGKKQQVGRGEQKPRALLRSGERQQEASADPQHLDERDKERKVEHRLGIDPTTSRK